MWFGDNDLLENGTLPAHIDSEEWHKARKASALLTNVLWHADGEHFGNARNNLFQQVLATLKAAEKWKRYAAKSRP